MCGVAGVWSPDGFSSTDEAKRRVATMAGMLAHRGPDGQGAWADGRVALGHTRLAVIDLSPAAAQPMADRGGTVHIAFNGEIYNFRDLRSELAAAGHSFRTHSDTEVILEGYKRWGKGVLDRLRGMFAIALWDSGRRTLLLTRDRVGKKPLCYAWHDGHLLFGSEIKAILAWPGFERAPDLLSIHQYLTYQYVPAPRAAFAGVSRLEPGSWMEVAADGSVSSGRYWQLAPPGRDTPVRDKRELEEEIRRRFDDAVACRLVSDVPLGAFLSGGIDSASVVASMARVSGAQIKTFTVGFEEAAYDERAPARLVAERYGTDHHEFVVRPDAVDILPKLVWHYGEPYADSSAVPTYYLSQIARRHVTVALNGDGGDESFLGYPRYAGAWLGGRIDVLPLGIRKAMSAIGHAIPAETSNIRLLRYLRRFLMEAAAPDRERYGKWITFFSKSDTVPLYGEALSPFAGGDALTLLDRWLGGDGPIAARVAYADIHTYLPDDLLVKVDIATMAHGLEGRSPFLDHQLMEFAARIPASAKMKGVTTKSLLKSAMAERLPADIVHRPKMGFGVPIDRWLRDELRDMAYDLLLSQRARERGLFRADEVKRLLDDHCAGRRAHHYRLWALLFLELWFRMWIDAPEIPRSAP